jgi:hypothetical protein
VNAHSLPFLSLSLLSLSFSHSLFISLSLAQVSLHYLKDLWAQVGHLLAVGDGQRAGRQARSKNGLVPRVDGPRRRRLVTEVSGRRHAHVRQAQRRQLTTTTSSKRGQEEEEEERRREEKMKGFTREEGWRGKARK